MEFAADLVHLVGGMSKDFGASGLRVGWVWSRNAELNRALGNISYFCGVGGHMQWMVTDVSNGGCEGGGCRVGGCNCRGGSRGKGHPRGGRLALITMHCGQA